ncbi:MAG TPA: Rieske 2Fe-2S domain-containing protein [Thermomicrobiales bacterium]
MAQQAKTISDLVEVLPWLDTIAEPVQQATNALFGKNGATRKLKDWLNGTPMRHRIHPALITVPIGAWTTGLVLDLLETRADRPKDWSRGADAAVVLGIMGALPSVATGLADWTDTYDHQRRVGIAHALLNSVGLTFYGASLGLRLADRRGYARLCSTVGYSVIMLSGILGGELVYTLGVNVPHIIYPKPPEEFTDVLASVALPQDKPVVVEAGRVPVMLLRRGETIHAVENWCPHAGGPLNEGKIVGDEVYCPWHDSHFCLRDGAPTQGPASTPLRTFAVKEEGGRIRVRPLDSDRS